MAVGLVVLPERVVWKVVGCIRIQAWWRGVRQRKNQLRLYHGRKLLRKIDWSRVTLETTKYADYALINRAVYKLRSWFQYSRVKSRISTLSKIGTYVAGITSQTLTCRDQDYLTIDSLTAHTRI